MNLDQIKQEAEKFFHERHGTITSYNAMRDVIEFAKHCVDKATGWRPIEDAPKDGTEILAWLPHEDQISIVRFGMQKMWLEGSRPCGEPTHWQPLPQPQEAA